MFTFLKINILSQKLNKRGLLEMQILKGLVLFFLLVSVFGCGRGLSERGRDDDVVVSEDYEDDVLEEKFALEVTGIIFGENPIVIINGELLKQGDVLDNFKVEEIGQDYVRLWINGKSVVKALAGKSDVDREEEFRAYQDRMVKRDQAIAEIKRDRLLEAMKRQEEQEEVLQRAHKARIQEAVQKEIERKRREEESAALFGGRPPYQACRLNSSGSLTGTCFPTEEEIRRNYLSPNQYLGILNKR